MKQKNLKLVIELVPKKVWFSSFCQLSKGSQWAKMKKELFEKEGRKCWICGKGSNRLEAHEFWEYNDINHTQKLIGIHHICSMCHKIKHIGFWCYTLTGQKALVEVGLTEENLIKHFCKVNDCSKKEFEKHEKEAFKTWKERSKYKWKQDFSKYTSIIAGNMKLYK